MRISRSDARRLGIPMHTVRANFSRRDVMNGTERLYAQHLDMRIRSGEVRRHDFESIRLRLADDTWYTPDFSVYLSDGTLEFHEVKGFWRDDARVKFKVAAEKFPFVFVAIRRVKGRWEFERLEPKRR